MASKTFLCRFSVMISHNRYHLISPKQNTREIYTYQIPASAWMNDWYLKYTIAFLSIFANTTTTIELTEQQEVRLDEIGFNVVLENNSLI